MRKLKFKNEHVRIRARARSELGAAMLADLSAALESGEGFPEQEPESRPPWTPDREPERPGPLGRDPSGRFQKSEPDASASAKTEPDDKGTPGGDS